MGGEGTKILPGLPAVAGKPVHLTFDGGLMTSDARILLLAANQGNGLGSPNVLADCIERNACAGAGAACAGRDDPLGALLIAAGYPGNSDDALRADPADARGRSRAALPESGADLCSQGPSAWV